MGPRRAAPRRRRRREGRAGPRGPGTLRDRGGRRLVPVRAAGGSEARCVSAARDRGAPVLPELPSPHCLALWEGDALLPGYGWVFPLPDGSLNVGAGLLNTFTGFKDVSAQRLFDAFVRMIGEEWDLSEETAEGRVLSGSLPMGMNRRPLAMPWLLLVGDASGLVISFIGEGISVALELVLLES